MDRKGIAAVALAVIVLVLWQFENSKVTERKIAEKRAAEAAAKALSATTPASAGGQAVPEEANPAAATPSTLPPPIPQAAPPVVESADTPSVEYSFTNVGGGIQRSRLKNHKAEHGSNVVMNQFGTLSIGAISEGAGGQILPSFTKVDAGATGQVIYEMTDQRQLKTRKTFTLPQSTGLREEYLATLEVSFTNTGSQPLPVGNYYVHTGSAAPIHKVDQAQYTGAAWYPNGKFIFKNVSTFKSGGFMGFGKSDAPVFTENAEKTRWAGVTNQYFSAIVTPLEAEGNGVWARRFAVDEKLIGTAGEPGATAPVPANANNDAAAPHAEAVDGALAMPGFTLAPGQTATQRFEIYTGPREYRRLKSLGHGEEEIMEFGIFKIVSKVLLTSMNWLNSKFGSYALAIIVLTIIIRGLMWPLQNKATQSMKKMQALQPKMADLKVKYKDDPARQQQELMKLYKDYQINPAAGCLPMLVQIPVFFGFYSMLGKAVELRNARFLWVNDLSQMDTVATIPLLDQPLNVLPLLMAVTMLWQMSLSPKTGDPVQQRVFMFMPLIFVFFCYKYASALALYWTVQNLFSVVQLYLTRNQTAPVLQKVSTAGKKR